MCLGLQVQVLRFSIWLFCCVSLTTSTHDIDIKFSEVKECTETWFKTQNLVT